MIRYPEEFRQDGHYGDDGVFSVPCEQIYFLCIASHYYEWEHVSVSLRNYRKPRCPTWPEMHRIKELFWEPEDCVMQLHPPKSQYINNHPYCLHLWRPTANGEAIPIPPNILVGV